MQVRTKISEHFSPTFGGGGVSVLAQEDRCYFLGSHPQVKTSLWGKADSNKGNESTFHYRSEEMS